MKKALLAIVLLCAVAMQAQAVTPENIQGRWKISSYSTDGYTVDFDKKTYTISNEMRETYEAEDMASIEENLQFMIEMGQGALLEFKGNTLIRRQEEGGESYSEERDFKIEGGKLVLPAGKNEYTQAEQTSEASLKDGRLVLYQPEVGVETVYAKIK